MGRDKENPLCAGEGVWRSAGGVRGCGAASCRQAGQPLERGGHRRNLACRCDLADVGIQATRATPDTRLRLPENRRGPFQTGPN